MQPLRVAATSAPCLGSLCVRRLALPRRAGIVSDAKTDPPLDMFHRLEDRDSAREAKTDPPPDAIATILGELVSQGARNTETLGALARQVGGIGEQVQGAIRAFTEEHAARGEESRRIHHSLDLLAHEVRRALSRLGGVELEVDEQRELRLAKRNGPYGG